MRGRLKPAPHFLFYGAAVALGVMVAPPLVTVALGVAEKINFCLTVFRAAAIISTLKSQEKFARSNFKGVFHAASSKT